MIALLGTGKIVVNIRALEIDVCTFHKGPFRVILSKLHKP